MYNQYILNLNGQPTRYKVISTKGNLTYLFENKNFIKL